MFQETSAGLIISRLPALGACLISSPPLSLSHLHQGLWWWVWLAGVVCDREIRPLETSPLNSS